MKVRDLMHGAVISVRPGDRLSEAAQQMAWANVRHLVVADQGRVVGMLNERDVVANSNEIGFSQPVSAFMQSPVHSAHPEEDALDLVERMRTEKIDGMPVLDAGRIVGIVTTTDLLMHVVRREIAQEESEPVVNGVMTPDPDTARLDDLFVDAISRMNYRGVRHLPIIDAGYHVIGMLSDRDVRSAVGDLLASGEAGGFGSLRLKFLRVGDVVHRAPQTISETAPVSQLVRMLVDQRIGAVPVVDEQERLVGIASYIDVLRGGQRSTQPRAAVSPEHHARGGIGG